MNDSIWVEMNQVYQKFSVNPYRILGLEVPKLEVNALANLTVIDPETKWIVDKRKFKSRSRNTPFHGWELQGKVAYVINNGFYYRND